MIFHYHAGGLALRSPKSPGDGFTLIEAVVAIMIVAIAASVATPAFNEAIQRHRVHQAALRVQADLRLARRMAEQTGQTVHVDLDAADHRVTVRGAMDFERSGQPQTLSCWDEYQCEIVSVELGGGNTVAINGYGLFEVTGTLTLRAGPFQRSLLIEPEACHVQ